MIHVPKSIKLRFKFRCYELSLAISQLIWSPISLNSNSWHHQHTHCSPYTLLVLIPVSLPKHSKPSFGLFTFYLQLNSYPLAQANFKSNFIHETIVYYLLSLGLLIILTHCLRVSLLHRASLFASCSWSSSCCFVSPFSFPNSFPSSKMESTVLKYQHYWEV